jgi:stage III sporulation protein AD
MEAEILKICGIGVLCALAGALVGRAVGGISLAIRLAGLALGGGALVALLGEVIGHADSFGFSGADEYMSVMLRALGICVLCRVCSDVCRDCGESTLASTVESAGKITMVLLAMPIVKQIIEYARQLLDKI